MYACVLLSSMLLLVVIVMSYVVVTVRVTGFVCFLCNNVNSFNVLVWNSPDSR